MPKKNSNNRNLIIIGNGFDLSLGLRSGFNSYMGINSFKDYFTYHSRFNRIYYFIKLFQKFQTELIYKIREVCNTSNLRLRPIFLFNKKGESIKRSVHLSKRNGHFEQTAKGSFYVDRSSGINGVLHPKHYFVRNNNGELKLDENDNPFERVHFNLSSYEIAQDYFVLKLFFNKHYKITKESFSYINGKDLDLFKHYDSLDDKLDRLDKWGNKKTDKLLKAVRAIKSNYSHDKVNFWDILLLFELYIDIRTDISLHGGKKNKHKYLPKTWYDVENTIKEYLISIINQPFSQKRGYYRIFDHNYHTLDYYVRNSYLASWRYFNLFTGINRYIDLLHDVDVDSASGECCRNECVISYSLYNRIIKYSRYNDLLVHYPSHAPYSLSNDLNILAPFMFIMLKKFNGSYMKGDKSLFNFLHQQLRDFGDKFSSYLQNQIVKNFDEKETNRYAKKSLNHLRKLSVTSNLKKNNMPFSVLDFNYTPLDKSIRHCEHIHGSLKDKDIVIGVGEQAINRLRSKINLTTYDQLYSFTKTYQLFSFNKHVDEKFFIHIKNIIFFGHSFGVNDYPYFEALFDHFHLYSNSKINLIFIYNKHNGKSYNDVKRDMIPKIVNLLRTYGRSLSNEAHRNNLIAKMFAENRIKLYPVNFNNS